jgi:hypothetical protein
VEEQLQLAVETVTNEIQLMDEVTTHHKVTHLEKVLAA